MELKEVKREVENLPELKTLLQGFKKNWIKPLKSGNNQFSVPHKIPLNKSSQIDHYLKGMQKNMEKISELQSIKERLNTYARYLIELKLASLNGDSNKSKRIINNLVYDPFLSIKGMISDLSEMDSYIKSLTDSYNLVLDLLNKELLLEDYLHLINLDHKNYLNSLQRLQLRQKELTKKLGYHLLESAKGYGKHF